MISNFVRKLLGLPSQLEVYLNVGTQFLCEGKYDYGLECFRQALELDPGNERVQACILLAESYLSKDA